MGYCFMSTQKIKTMGQMMAKYNHNYRKANVENADPALYNRNEELLPLQNAQGQHTTYNEAFRERTAALPHRIRSNAVLAIEVITTFSRDDNIDIEDWKKENVKWLQKEFNKAGDGKGNVLSVVYHADEPGNVHCHALVVPIDERGRLNAKYYLDGSRTLTQMQTSYAKEMQKFGLERGLEGGHAKHKDIRKYYTELNRAKKLPEPLQKETGTEYRDRVLENLEELQLAALKKRNDDRIKFERNLEEKRLQMQENVRDKLSKEYRELNIMNNKINNVQKNINDLEVQKSDLERDLQKQKQVLGMIKDISKKVDFYDDFQSKFNALKENNPKVAERVINAIELLEHADSGVERNFER